MSALLASHPWVAAFLAFLEEVRGFSPETAVTYRKALLDFRRRMGIEVPIPF
jgi:site-specific recombinase XerD